MAAPIPLTSLSDDVVAVESALERIEGTVVLVAHAYAGAIISGCTNERVRALVFVVALTPEEGETVGEVFRIRWRRSSLLTGEVFHGFPRIDLAQPLSERFS